MSASSSDRFLTHSLRDPRVLRILQAALDAVDPRRLVTEYLEKTRLPPYQRLFLLGIGKAAEPMTLAAADALPEFTRALVITKRASSGAAGRIHVMEASHPVPDERSQAAGRAALDFASALEEDDLLICLISGGGSALVTAPKTGITLAEIRSITSFLLKSGAAIDEINALRRRLDAIKGGGLARAAKARVLTLLLSDAIGDHLEVIASGPTAPDPTTGEQARLILDRYRIPASREVRRVLSSQAPPEASGLARVTNVIIGNNHLAAQAASAQAAAEGLQAEVPGTDLQGEARLVGHELASKLREAAINRPRPFCIIAGGETTVTLRGDGKGGRNQELALAVVDELADLQKVLLISLATDGDDGPTDAAGAVVSGDTRRRAEAVGMLAADYLARNDSYPYFEALGDLLKPGYTGTNVNDLIFLLGL